MDSMYLGQMVSHTDGSIPYDIGGAGMSPSLPLRTVRLDPAGALVISKHFAGLSADWVDQAREVVRKAADGVYGEIKFLVFDLAGEADPSAPRARDAELLLGEIANLILHAPIITVAHARKSIGGADLELALACSMLICDEHAEFSFAADPVESVATYALLAQKIGFVRAERLMEQEAVLDAAQMRELLLLKETTQGEHGLHSLEGFLVRATRRQNSAAAMYRAQRISTPLMPELFGGQRPN